MKEICFVLILILILPVASQISGETGQSGKEAKEAAGENGVAGSSANEGDLHPEGGSGTGPGEGPALKSIFSARKIDSNKGGTASPDGKRIAYYQRSDAGYHYVIAGPEGKTNESIYENVRDFVFSQDGKHHAYKAFVGNKWQAVVDGFEGQRYDEINKFTFSQDGGCYAYRAKKGDQAVVVFDGKEEGPYEGVSDDPIVSSGCQHVAYTISEKGTNYVVIDRERQEKVGWNPVFSPDGGRWAYSRSTAYVGDPCYIVLDGEVIDLDHDNSVRQMVFGPDGKRFAYVLVPGAGAYGDHIAVVDGVRGNAYPFPGVGKIVFSPDGRRVAYFAKAKDSGFMMVLDGEEGPIYDEINDPIFSPDGNHVAYVAKDKDGKFVVSDGHEGTRYRDIWGVTFSIDGRLAYVAKDSREGKDVQLIVMDGREEHPYQYGWYGQGIRSGPVFSPDGSHVVYVANDGGKAEFVVVDGTRHLHPWTFLGGLSWGEGSPIIFDSGGSFHYLAENETGTFIVEVTIPAAASPEPDRCAWTGIWDTNLGIMDLEQSGESASGLIANAYWLGQIAADGGDKRLAGTIARPPTYRPPDVDSFEINMSEDCQNFTGHSRNGMEGPWSFEWTGRRG